MFKNSYGKSVVEVSKPKKEEPKVEFATKDDLKSLHESIDRVNKMLEEVKRAEQKKEEKQPEPKQEEVKPEEKK